MLDRRSFLTRAAASAAAGATFVLVPGCNSFAPESGPAFEPWNYPRHDEPPHLSAVSAAILAASPHNTQPWLFAATPEQIDVFSDLDRHLGTIDPFRRELHMGLGCAIENAVLGLHGAGRGADVLLLPSDGDPTHVARIRLTERVPSEERDALAAAIPVRRMNRGRYASHPVPGTLEADLRALVADTGVHLAFLAAPDAKARFREATIAAAEAIVADEEMNRDSHAWYRHSLSDITEHRDGLTLDATGNGATLRFFGKAFDRPSAAQAGGYWIASTRGAQTTAGAFVMIASASHASREEQLRCGHALQRMALFATDRGLAMHPLSQLTERRDRELMLGLEPVATQTLADLLGQPDLTTQLCFRIGYAAEHQLASPRRPLAWVLS